MKKQVLSMLLALCMICTLLPMAAFADSGVAIDSTNFPDDVFRALVSERFDTDSNGELSSDEIGKVKFLQDLSNMGIKSFKGIEYFTELLEFSGVGNSVETLDLSNLTKLYYVNCASNGISTLLLDNCKGIEYLDCGKNELTSLDVSDCTVLVSLNCDNNKLNEIDISSNTELAGLTCSNNNLTELDVSKNGKLADLTCTNNKLASLDVSKNGKLVGLTCTNNKLTSLDVSQNTGIQTLRCDKNMLTSLDLSKNTNLVGIRTEISEQNYEIVVGADRKFDLSKLPAGFKAENAGDWEGGSVNGNILTVNADADAVTYHYFCENGMSMTVNLDIIGSPFTDVSGNSVYFDAVLWAVDKGITNGTTATTFAPNKNCTRGQVVTFLWREAGSPEPESSDNPFDDVSDSGPCKPYYKAILWAAENGITTGYPDGSFRPNDTVTRAQFVTFLWRAEGSPEPESSDNPFNDVSATGSGAPYYKAILWAVEQGVTNGYGRYTFRPNATCTRWQVVLFMYRAYN